MDEENPEIEVPTGAKLLATSNFALRPIVRKQRERIEELESELENALVRAEEAEEKADTAEDLEAALFRIAKYDHEKSGSWAEGVARKVLRLHGLKTPPE